MADIFVPIPTSRVPELNRVQQLLSETFAIWMLKRFLDLDNPIEVTVTTADTRVNHYLGRRARGRIIIAQDADARVYDGTRVTDEATAGIYFHLRASATTTVKVLVF